MIAMATAVVTFVFAGINTPPTHKAQAQRTPASPHGALPDSGSDVIEQWHSKFSKATHAYVVPVIESCFAKVRKAEPKLAGTLVVRLFVSGEPGASISVDRTRVVTENSTLVSSALEACVTGSKYDLKLDAPPIPVDFVADVTSELGKSIAAVH